MTALLLPTWAGWLSLTVWLAAYTAGVWWVAHHLERRRFDRLLDVARLLRQGGRVASVGSGTGDTVRLRVSYGQAYCPRCDRWFEGNEGDPEAREAFRAHLEQAPHTEFGKWADA